MKPENPTTIAITGGTGFVGRHLADSLLRNGHHVRLISNTRAHSPLEKTFPGRVTVHPVGIDDPEELTKVFTGCDAVAHCAGINREIGAQTYQNVHIQGTKNVIAACKAAQVARISAVGFLRARPDCGSPYHESKFQAEELIRKSGLIYTVFKPGIIYGSGDHLLDHLTHSLHTFPLFAFVGFEERKVRPLAVEDFAHLVAAACTSDALDDRTIAVTGPEELNFNDVVRKVARVVGRKPIFFSAPILFHQVLATCCELTMKVPLISKGQVRILSEDLNKADGDYELPPKHLRPTTPFMESHIRPRLPDARPFGFHDLRICT